MNCIPFSLSPLVSAIAVSTAPGWTENVLTAGFSSAMSSISRLTACFDVYPALGQCLALLDLYLRPRTW